MIEVTLYSRSDCHLCEEAKADLAALQAQIPHTLKVVDIDGNADLTERFAQEVPVVEVGPYRLKAPFTRQELSMTLGAAQDREKHIADLEESIRTGMVPEANTWTRADSFSLWISRHYLAVFNIIVLVFVGLPFLAPVLMKVGADGPARVIYSAYRLTCHQLAFRSWFLFGEQPVYPRVAAAVAGLASFQQATGLSEGDTLAEHLAAQNFTGSPEIGYKVAICERDVAIYGGILVFGLLFALTGRKIPPLPWYLWILIGILPIAVDGVSQLLSQPPLGFILYRESTPFLRTLTGFLFGFSTAWLGIPMVEESMRETRQIMEDKLKRVKRVKEIAAG
jgi:uncharacterized membrane protein